MDEDRSFHKEGVGWVWARWAEGQTEGQRLNFYKSEAGPWISVETYKGCFKTCEDFLKAQSNPIATDTLPPLTSSSNLQKSVLRLEEEAAHD